MLTAVRWRGRVVVACAALAALAPGDTLPCAGALTAAGQGQDLPALLAAGTLKPVNREVGKLPERADGVRVSEGTGPGVVWIEGTDFGEGTIELEVRGRDEMQRSFVGVAFHGKDDTTYEAVYLRPFNFRPDDAARARRAVQYISVPDYDWPRLRKEFPGEFESGVDPSVAPTEWVPLKVVVSGTSVEVRVGRASAPTLKVRRLGELARGRIGLWVGNNSNGDFAALRVTPSK